jgi:predicted nucleotidyltransferase
MRYLWRSGKMSTGRITNEMTKAIQLIITAEQRDVLAAFGFGSHFRGEPYNDVDILVVLKPGSGPLLPTYYALKSKLELLGQRLGVTMDLTVLTWEEFVDKPLRDMDSLVEIVR